MQKYTGIALVLGLVLMAACTGPASKDAALLSGVDFSAMLTMEEAIAIAQAEIPDGIPVGVELELEDDDENEPPAWEINLFIPNSQTVMGVEVDVHTGEVLEVEIEDETDE